MHLPLVRSNIPKKDNNLQQCCTQTKPKPTRAALQSHVLCNLGKDILFCIAKYLADDGKSWSALSCCCLYLSQTLPNFFDILNLRNQNRSVIDWTPYICRLINRCERYTGVTFKILVKCKNDDECRYIDLNGSVKIDKWTGLILNSGASMPRGYIYSASPELFFVPNKGNLVRMCDMHSTFTNNVDANENHSQL